MRLKVFTSRARTISSGEQYWREGSRDGGAELGLDHVGVNSFLPGNLQHVDVEVECSDIGHGKAGLN